MIERKALTSRVVKSAKTTGLTTEIWDTRTPNFGLKVTKRGHKRWIVKVRNNGLFRRVIIGECPEMSLKEARELVPKVQEEEGNDKANWAVKKVTARAARRRVMLALRKPWTFEEAVQDYMRFKTPNLKRGDYVDRRIELELIPLWGKKALSEITPYDVLDLTDTFLEPSSIRAKIGSLCLHVDGGTAADCVHLLLQEETRRKPWPARVEISRP